MIFTHSFKAVAGNAKRYKTKNTKSKMIDINKIEASPTAAHGTPLEEDPLAMPGSVKETEFPLLKAGKIVRFQVKSIDLEDGKSEGAITYTNETGKPAQNLKVVVTTEGEERSSTDEVIHKGFGVTTYMPLYASGKQTVAQVRGNILQFAFAVLGKNATVSPADVRDKPEMFIGKVVDAKVTISKDKSGKYGPRNNLRFVIPGE